MSIAIVIKPAGHMCIWLTSLILSDALSAQAFSEPQSFSSRIADDRCSAENGSSGVGNLLAARLFLSTALVLAFLAWQG